MNSNQNRIDIEDLATNPNTAEAIAAIAAEVNGLKTDLIKARREAQLAKDLSRQAVRLARGTVDVTAAAGAAVAAAPAPPAPVVTPVQRRTRAPVEVKGPPTLPIGDNTTTRDLNAAIEWLVTQRPYTFRELCDMTGARPGRVSGSLTWLSTRRTGPRVLNMGKANRGVWFIPNAELLARLREEDEPTQGSSSGS